MAFVWPMAEGQKKFPIGDGGTSADHVERQGPGMFAIDIPAGEGEIVVACHDGVVYFAGDTQGDCGISVDIRWRESGEQWVARTCHHSKVLVRTGEPVAVGQPIAEIGHTGRVLGYPGNHLHFLIEKDGQRQRPEELSYEEEVPAMALGPEIRENYADLFNAWWAAGGWKNFAAYLAFTEQAPATPVERREFVLERLDASVKEARIFLDSLAL